MRIKVNTRKKLWINKKLQVFMAQVVEGKGRTGEISVYLLWELFILSSKNQSQNRAGSLICTPCEVCEKFASWTYRSVSADVSWRYVQLVRQHHSWAWLHCLSELAPCSIFFFFFSFNASDDFGRRFHLRQIQFYPENKLSRKARPLPLLKAFCGYRSFTNRTHRLMS